MNEAAVSALNQRKSEMAMMDHGLVKVTKIQEWQPRDKEKEKERIQSVERKQKSILTERSESHEWWNTQVKIYRL